jgi:hypothetical protein
MKSDSLSMSLLLIGGEELHENRNFEIQANAKELRRRRAKATGRKS